MIIGKIKWENEQNIWNTIGLLGVTITALEYWCFPRRVKEYFIYVDPMSYLVVVISLLFFYFQFTVEEFYILKALYFGFYFLYILKLGKLLFCSILEFLIVFLL